MEHNPQSLSHINATKHVKPERTEEQREYYACDLFYYDSILLLFIESLM